MPKISQTSKPSKLPPKPLLKKLPPKPLNNLPEKLATAADREGLWVRDLVKFEDLLNKHKLPTKVSLEDLEKAHKIFRNKIRQTLARFE